MDVVGYTDRISAAPGEQVELLLSSTDPEVRIDLVRPVPDGESGQGLRFEPVESSLSGRYPAEFQPLHTGSYARVEGLGGEYTHDTFTVDLWIWPTRLEGDQTLAAHQDDHGRGWSLEVADDRTVRFSVTGTDGRRWSVSTGRRVRHQYWYHISATFDRAAEQMALVVRPRTDWPVASVHDISDPEAVDGAGPAASPAPARAQLLLAASTEPAGHPVRHFNGKLAQVRICQYEPGTACRSAHDRSGNAGSVAAWDFSVEPRSSRIVDVSGSGFHGETVQKPMRMVTGPDWHEGITRYEDDPSCYNALHFHDDDLDEAGWKPTVTWTVDRSLPSGVYALHARGATKGEDYVPVVVRPPRGQATAKALLVLPLFSYVSYGNLRALEEHLQTDTPHGTYIKQHGLNSLYDSHSDGSGVCYSSWRRPLLNFRFGYQLPLLEADHGFSADLHLVDWLMRQGYEFDVVTDEDVHHEGAALLSSYRTVLSGTHAEYWSGPMLDAFEHYLAAGGRYMYLSGNGMYWVTGLDEEKGHTVEVRRHGVAVSAWHTLPGEGSLSTTGEVGGLWRARGRPPQRLVGVGFSGCWADTPAASGCGYRRMPDSWNPRADFVFDGVDTELIGDFPNPVLSHGAAGYEVDRAEEALGTPPHALVLASATEFPSEHWYAAPEEMWRGQIRADMVFFETGNGGAVFSTGSITWCSALSYQDRKNEVSTITANVLDRFLRPEGFDPEGTR